MKVLGKIGEITLNYQMAKTDREGKTYYGERYTIFIECGDDTFMADSDWLHCQGKGGGKEKLKAQGIVEGAKGEATIRFGFRDWNGKRFHDITLTDFEPLVKKSEVQPQEAEPEAEPAPEPEPEPAPAPSAEAVQSEQGKSSDLPF
jgi:hypothetical protein